MLQDINREQRARPCGLVLVLQTGFASLNGVPGLTPKPVPSHSEAPTSGGGAPRAP
jgi:hypothetical protein